MMRILVLSESGYGAWFSALFDKEGHSVDYVVKSKYKDILAGIAPLFATSIPSPSSYDKYDFVMFDMTGNGRFADKVNAITPVIGDSALADMLEDDRKFGLEAMESSGIAVPPWEQFEASGLKAAIKFIKDTGKRYVFKPCGDNQDCASTYVSSGPDDLVRYLQTLSKQSKNADFVLQEFISGVEVSTEGFFTGTKWVFINNTFEEKKFMNDGIGPNTGCSGNLVYSHGLSEPKIFTQGLKKLTKFLKEHNYRGMIDLNCIVTDNECYGLEWTPRFGYDASATQTLLIKNDYASFLNDVLRDNRILVSRFSQAFAASVRLSIPPYPLETTITGVYKSEIPIKGIEPEDLDHCYMYDVKLTKNNDLVTAGHEGFVCCPMASADNPEHAFDRVKAMIERIKIPNMQYRTDIARKSIERYEKLKKAGWFSYSLAGDVQQEINS